MRPAAAAVALAAAAARAAGQQPAVFSLLTYGGVPDGVTDNQPAFMKAVAAVASAGGGVLYVPGPGAFLTSPFNLTSNLELRLDNATILGAPSFAAWPIVAPLPSYGRGRDFPGPRYEALIGCWNCSSVRLTSNSSTPGVIDGQGAAWWDAVKSGALKVTPGHLVEFAWSQRIEIDNLVFVDSPFWNLHLWSGRDAYVHDIAIRAPIKSTNTDGVDPDSWDGIRIERVDIRNGDDCIAVKSGWNQAGVQYGVPTVNVSIQDVYCETQSACLAIGSEMSGSVVGLVAKNITCGAAGQAVNVKSALGRGGAVRDIVIDGVDIVGPVGYAMAVGDGYRDQYPPAPIDPCLVPSMGNITIANVGVSGAGSVFARMAGDFQGLNQTQPAGCPSGFITGLHLINVTLPADCKWACGNVTGTALNVSPKPCSALLPSRDDAAR